ncbi:hypothetical protein TNCT_83301 [Trichonephila clavata]|uniref:Uncharacterized protein n=1 Tax=Trichonephila clavata TaxID=2740835 RepID=A0A8X6H3A7_TRICU|nr:hypothetical protein TNCT_83301 [Trichonephila clavata]
MRSHLNLVLYTLADPIDDVHETYLRTHPLFQLLNALKRLLKKELHESTPPSDDLLEKENKYLEELHYISIRMKQIYDNSCVRFSIRKLEGVLSSLLSWSLHIEKIGDKNSKGIENPSRRKHIDLKKKKNH